MIATTCDVFRWVWLRSVDIGVIVSVVLDCGQHCSTDETCTRKPHSDNVHIRGGRPCVTGHRSRYVDQEMADLFPACGFDAVMTEKEREETWDRMWAASESRTGRKSRRLWLAFLLLPIGVAAGVLWGAGWCIERIGCSGWWLCHKACRSPECRCEECREWPTIRAIWMKEGVGL